MYYFTQTLTVAVSKVFLPQRNAKKAQSCAEIFYCILMLCDPLVRHEACVKLIKYL